MGRWGVHVEVGGGRAGSRDTVTRSQDARRQPWDKKLIITLQVNGRSWREKWGGGSGGGVAAEREWEGVVGGPTDALPTLPPLHTATQTARRETGSSVAAD